jgi:hypothetical protein
VLLSRFPSYVPHPKKISTIILTTAPRCKRELRFSATIIGEEAPEVESTIA